MKKMTNIQDLTIVQVSNAVLSAIKVGVDSAHKKPALSLLLSGVFIGFAFSYRAPLINGCRDVVDFAFSYRAPLINGCRDVIDFVFHEDGFPAEDMVVINSMIEEGRDNPTLNNPTSSSSDDEKAEVTGEGVSIDTMVMAGRLQDIALYY